jgi:hypothetical protein
MHYSGIGALRGGIISDPTGLGESDHHSPLWQVQGVKGTGLTCLQQCIHKLVRCEVV